MAAATGRRSHPDLRDRIATSASADTLESQVLAIMADELDEALQTIVFDAAEAVGATYELHNMTRLAAGAAGG